MYVEIQFRFRFQKKKQNDAKPAESGNYVIADGKQMVLKLRYV